MRYASFSVSLVPLQIKGLAKTYSKQGRAICNVRGQPACKMQVHKSFLWRMKKGPEGPSFHGKAVA